MPSMPIMNPTASSAESNDSGLSPSFAEGAGSHDSAPANGSENDLGYDEVSQAPKAIDPSKNVHNQVAVKAPLLRRGIEVVAVDKGFYNQDRKVTGDKFFIVSEEEFGDWFRCTDPVLEAKRVEFIKNKKMKVR